MEWSLVSKNLEKREMGNPIKEILRTVVIFNTIRYNFRWFKTSSKAVNKLKPFLIR